MITYSRSCQCIISLSERGLSTFTSVSSLLHLIYTSQICFVQNTAIFMRIVSREDRIKKWLISYYVDVYLNFTIITSRRHSEFLPKTISRIIQSRFYAHWSPKFHIKFYWSWQLLLHFSVTRYPRIGNRFVHRKYEWKKYRFHRKKYQRELRVLYDIYSVTLWETKLTPEYE